MAGPVVFVSDLGLRDEFVGVCHLVIARIAPDVRVVDLSHGVPPHDIQAGAMMLANGMGTPGRTRWPWGSWTRASARRAGRSWSGPRMGRASSAPTTASCRSPGGRWAA